MQYVLVGCRSLVVLVFVVSLVGKLRSRRAYAEFVAATGRLSRGRLSRGRLSRGRLSRGRLSRGRLSRGPAATARRLATAVLAVELAVVALVPVPGTTSIGFAVAAALLGAFTGAVLLALRRGERAPCRCFGSTEHPLGYPQVVRNLVLAAVCLLGLVGGRLPVAAPDPAGALLAVVAGAVAATVVVTAEDIAALFRSA